jgi:hypothetical protein
MVLVGSLSRGSTQKDAEELARQLGETPGARFAWGEQLAANKVRHSASTGFVVDRFGVVRASFDLSGPGREKNGWLLRAAIERVLKED